MTSSQITRLINWVAMLIALSLLALVAYHIYQRHVVPQGSNANYDFDDLPTLSASAVSADINTIIDKHVFGEVPTVVVNKPAVKVQAPKPAPKPVPKTPLNITLTGVIGGATPESGMAMLEVERGKTLIVEVGEKIGKTDATLSQVLPGEILIDRSGTIESVKMLRKTLSIAKTDTQDLSSLPQPYVEQTSATLPAPTRRVIQPAVQKPSTVQPNAGQSGRQAALSRREKFQERARKRAEERKNNTEKMGVLPVPKALQRL